MKAWLITVNYKDTFPTSKFIKTLKNTEKIDKVKIIIADNSTSQKTKNELTKIKKKSNLDINLFFFRKNLFYWPAVEKVFTSTLENEEKYPDWLIICNNDMEVNDANFFNKIFSYDSSKALVIGPKILNNKNENLNPFMIDKLSKLQLYYWKIYFSSYFLSKFLNSIKKIKKTFYVRKNKFINVSKVYAVHGSMMFFSKAYFENGGIIDNRFSLFCEELTTAEIANNIGCDILYEPSISVYHNEHSSTGKISDQKKYKIAKKSHFFFIDKYLKK